MSVAGGICHHTNLLIRKVNPDGYNVELVRAIAEVMGLSVEFKLGHWPENAREITKQVKLICCKGCFTRLSALLLMIFLIPTAM